MAISSDVWGLPDVESIGPFLGPSIRVSVLVDGRAYQGDPRAIPLRDGTRVTVQMTGPAGPTGGG